MEPGIKLARFRWSWSTFGPVEFDVISRTPDEAETALALKYWATDATDKWANGRAGDLARSVDMGWEDFIARVNRAVDAVLVDWACMQCNDSLILRRRNDTREPSRGFCRRCQPEPAVSSPSTIASGPVPRTRPTTHAEQKRPPAPEPPECVGVGDHLGHFSFGTRKFDLYALTSETQEIRWALQYWSTWDGGWVNRESESLANRRGIPLREFITRVSEVVEVRNAEATCPKCESQLRLVTRTDASSKAGGVCLPCRGFESVAEMRHAEYADREAAKRQSVKRWQKSTVVSFGEDFLGSLAPELPTPAFWSENGLACISRRLGIRFSLERDLGSAPTGEPIWGKFEPEHGLISITRSLVREGPNTWTFVLGHQIGHAVLHADVMKRLHIACHLEGPGILEEKRPTTEVEWIEWQANAFALGLLMPRHEVMRVVVDRQKALGITRNLGAIYVGLDETSRRDFDAILQALSEVFGVTGAKAYQRISLLEIVHDQRMDGLRHVGELLKDR